MKCSVEVVVDGIRVVDSASVLPRYWPAATNASINALLWNGEELDLMNSAGGYKMHIIETRYYLRFLVIRLL